MPASASPAPDPAPALTDGARYRALIEQSPVAAHVLDAAGRTLAVNPAFERLFGVGAARMAGRNVLDDPGPSADATRVLLERALAGEVTRTPPVQRAAVPSGNDPLHDDSLGAGRAPWVEVTAYPVRGADGRVAEVVLLADDVTARVEAEAALAEHNAALQAQQLELELANQQLQEQAAELEAANEELHDAAQAREAALARLAESEARLRRVAESGIVGLFFWELAGGITEANDAFLAMLGYTQADLAAGRVDWRRMTPPEYAAADAAAVGELLATGRHGQVLKEYLGRDGRRVPVLIQSAFLDGSRTRGVCVCLDDTARRHAEARLGRVLAETPAAIAVLLGPDHVVQSANEMFLRLLGRRDYVGRPAREAAPELVAQGFIALMDEVYRTGVPFAGREAPLVWDRDGDGTMVEGFFDFVYQPVHDPAGAVEGVLVFAVEATAGVRARRAVEELNARLQAEAEAADAERRRLAAVLDALPVGVWLTDAAGAITSANPAASHIWGAAPLTRGVDDYVVYEGYWPAGHPRAGRRLAAEEWVLARAVRGGVTVPAEPVDIRRVDGSRGQILTSAAPIPGPDGRPAGALALALDVSELHRVAGERDRALDEARAALARAEAERARAEEARAAAEAARAAAEEANAAKSQFLANMSHELRTPLNAIAGYVQLVDMGLHGPVTEDQRQALGRVARAQAHLLGLIDDVLNYARLEGGRVEYDLRPVAVADVLADVLPLVEPQLAAKGLAFAVDAPGAPVRVLADREKLGQVLVNLLSNAVKFTPAGGRVAVAVALADGAAAVRVRDTGRGIPADKLEAVFEPFVQVGKRYAGEAPGTGLGLAISRDLARGMGGDLTAESAPGAGSTFTLTLPIA